jgi:hypothetical protein
MTPIQIVRKLTESFPYFDTGHGSTACALCGADTPLDDGGPITSHDTDCPYRLAWEYLGGHL